MAHYLNDMKTTIAAERDTFLAHLGGFAVCAELCLLLHGKSYDGPYFACFEALLTCCVHLLV